MRATAPSEVLRGLHDAIARSEETDGFCTALFLTAEPDAGSIRTQLSAGGHHLPLCLRADGSIEEVGRTGHLLGMLEPLRLHDAEVILAPGEAMVLYTDGVIEARRGDELFGHQRVVDVLEAHRAADARELADALATAAVAFQGVHTRDDIAVVVLRAPGGTVPSPSS